MSVITFTKESCKNIDTMNKTLVEHFEEHFAMYSLSTIKKFPKVEVVNNGKLCYIIKCNKKESVDIIDVLSSFQCSNFGNTLIPVFNLIDEGLLVEFKLAGE